MISMNRPEMEPRPYAFLLQSLSQSLSLQCFLACTWRWFLCSLPRGFFVSFYHMREKAWSICSWLHCQLLAQYMAQSKHLVITRHFEWVNSWKKVGDGDIWGCCSKWGPWTTILTSSRNPESQVPPHISCHRIWILIRFPADAIGTSQFKGRCWFEPFTGKRKHAGHEELPTVISKTPPTWGRDG